VVQFSESPWSVFQSRLTPALERLQAAAGGKNSLLADAIQSPAGSMNAADEFNKVISRRLGVGFNELPPDQKTKAVRFWVWQRANRGVSASAEEKAFKDIFYGGAFTK